MRYVLKILNFFVDAFLAWFTPGWRRNGREACSALARYIRYNRPEMPRERMEQLGSLREELREALLFWRKDAVIELTRSVADKGEGLRGFKRSGWVEMAESFFVIMVIFIGIRTYYAQPFRIPTGSMQPTLNGIIIHPLEEAEAHPSLPERCWNAITRGSSYVDITVDSPKRIVGLEMYPYFLIFTRTEIIFDHGDPVSVPCAKGAVAEYLRNAGKLGRTLQPGETLIRARIDSGDMVVVNRMAYHFRRPERGETFVFDTRGINTEVPAGMPDQSKASHYIKRLCGVPGDTLHIESPHLIVNGKPAQEPAIARVAACQAPYNARGYNALHRLLDASVYDQAFFKEGHSVRLKKDGQNPNASEYLALGDNTVNSKDSRYWGPVRQFNVLGPAFITLWPFLPHWGGVE